MTRSQILIITLVFLGAVVVRLSSLAEASFFCDVPGSILAIEKGTMKIQFPGYSPFLLVVRALGSIVGGPFAGAKAFSLLCGLAAAVYCMLFGYERAGFPGALLTSVVMGFSPVTVYFSCVGASYTTDLLAMSALIYHGNRVLTKNSGRDYNYAVAWFIFGCVMRSLSFPFAGLGILYLLGKSPTRSHIIFTVAMFALGAFLYLAPTFYYFGSLHAILDSMGPAKTTVGHDLTLRWFAGNEIRNILFTAWSLNIFAVVILGWLWFARKVLNRSLSTFFVLLAGPYACFMLWYICHAGYICMLLPVFICAPWLAEKTPWLDLRAAALAAVFAIIALLQFFVARPIPFTGNASLVLNTYLLTYTYQGIQQSMFDNLQDWADRNHLPHTGKAQVRQY